MLFSSIYLLSSSDSETNKTANIKHWAALLGYVNKNYHHAEKYDSSDSRFVINNSHSVYLTADLIANQRSIWAFLKKLDL